MPSLSVSSTRNLLDLNLPELARSLSQLDDGLPIPRVFSWDPPEPIELQLGLTPDDIKTVLVFEQLLQQKRKSGKHFQALKELAARHPAPELEMLLLTYLTQWLPAEAEQRFAAQLEAHPDWLLLRSLWATRGLLEAPPEHLPLALVAFLARMNDRLELHQHVDGPVRADLANVFYHATSLFFLLADRPERALYGLNVLSRTGPAASAEKLLERLLQRAEAAGWQARLQQFVAAGAQP